MAIDEDDQSVGYRRPPRANRFKAGTSGNPNGRPKRSPTLRSDLVVELTEPVNVIEEDGKVRQVSKQRAILRAIAAAAVGGDIRAAAMMLDLTVRLLGVGASDAPDSIVDGLTDDQALEDFVAREIARRATSRTDEK